MNATLTPDQLRQLAALQNRPTLYEIEIVAPDGRKALLAYSAQRSGRGLRTATSQRAEAVLRFLGADKKAGFTATTGCRYHTHRVDGGGLIRFSNRTKRDVIMEASALPYVAAEAA